MVTSLEPGNTEGSSGVDDELASFLKDEYFATASASLEQYKNAVNVSLTEIKTFATGSTTIEGAVVDWIEANVVTTLHVTPSAIPVIAKVLDGTAAGITLAADFLDSYTNSDHLGTLSKDLVADGVGLLAAGTLVPVALGLGAGVAGAAIVTLGAAALTYEIKEHWSDLETLFDTDKGDTKTASEFADDANSAVSGWVNDAWATTGTGGAQTLIDAISGEVPSLPIWAILSAKI